MKLILPCLSIATTLAWKQEIGFDSAMSADKPTGQYDDTRYWSTDCGPLPNFHNLNEDNYEVLYRVMRPDIETSKYYPMVQALLAPLKCDDHYMNDKIDKYEMAKFEKEERAAERERRAEDKRIEKEERSRQKEEEKRRRQEDKELEKQRRQEEKQLWKEERQRQKEEDKRWRQEQKEYEKEQKRIEKENKKYNKYNNKYNKYRAVLDRRFLTRKSSKTWILRFERGTYSIFDPKFVKNIDFPVRKRYQLDF